MDLPPELIGESLGGYCICYFKHKDHAQEVPPHYWITIPSKNNSWVLLCIITSQIEKRERHYQKVNSNALPSLVKVTPTDLPFLVKESVIDCNKVLLVEKRSFYKVIDPKYKFRIITWDVPKDLQKRITVAVKSSPLVLPYIKNSLK